MAHKNARSWLAALLLIPAPAMAQAASGLDGDWDGILTAPGGIKEHFALRIESHDGVTDGALVATDEGGTQIPITAIMRDGDNVDMGRAKTPGFIKGVIAPDGASIQGTLGSAGFPLIFTRRAVGAAAPAASRRPQEPVPPFPYRSEDVTFPSAGGVTLAGTLTMPAGPGPFPAVVLVQGSGPHDRNEEILRHKPFLVLADTLTQRGIAVLRADKRGVGKSTGDYANATSEDFAADTQAAITYLRTVKNINAKKIGLIGHSEGGLIAPMVAAKDPSVAFIVLMAGPGVKGTDLGQLQTVAIGRAVGVTPADLEKQVEAFRRMAAAAITAKDTQDARKAIATALPDGATTPQARATVERLSSPWGRFMLAYDPAPTLRQVRCPVLAINGALDLQVPPKEDLAGIKAALAEDSDVTVMELPGLNHLFQTARTGAPSEYNEIEETIAPSALAVIGDWVVKHGR